MTARRRGRQRRTPRPSERKEPLVSDELKDDLPLKTKFRCLIAFVLFWVALIGLALLIFWWADPNWQKRIDSGNPPTYGEVADYYDSGDVYGNWFDEETGIRHVVWESYTPENLYSEGRSTPEKWSYMVAEFKNDLMTKFVETDSSDEVTKSRDEVTKIILEWDAD